MTNTNETKNNEKNLENKVDDAFMSVISTVSATACAGAGIYLLVNTPMDFKDTANFMQAYFGACSLGGAAALAQVAGNFYEKLKGGSYTK